MASARRREKLALIGNHRCVDFVNTEILLGPAEAEGALRRWSGTPAGARAVVEARTLRAHFRAMLEHIERGRPIAASTLEAINTLLGPAHRPRRARARSPRVPSSVPLGGACPCRSPRAGGRDRERFSMSRRFLSRPEVRKSYVYSVLLRPQQEPGSPLVQYERVRQSDEGRRVPSARQRRPG